MNAAQIQSLVDKTIAELKRAFPEKEFRWIACDYSGRVADSEGNGSKPANSPVDITIYEVPSVKQDKNLEVSLIYSEIDDSFELSIGAVKTIGTGVFECLVKQEKTARRIASNIASTIENYLKPLGD